LANKKKRVLIISYYWPPCGGIAVLRCLKFAKYLSQLGWEPVILAPDEAHYPSIDYSNDKDIPDNAIILKQKIWEPYHIYKFITRQKKEASVNNVFYVKDKKLGWAHKASVWIRSNFFIPDARCMWINPAVDFLVDYLKENPVDAILSDGPPHSNTRIATLVKQKTGTPWLADFQDPWTQVDYYSLLSLTKWGDAKHRKLEQEAFKTADKTTIVSPTWKRELEEIGAKNVSVVYWGYDPDDYKDLSTEVDEKFVFTHLGILGYDRNPSTFFKVVQSLCQENAAFKADFRLRLVGQVDYSVVEEYTALGLADNVELVGSVDRKRALELMAKSTVLLLLLNQQANAQGRMPGKLFEYLATQRPILSFGPQPSDVQHVIDESKSGFYCEYDEAELIKSHLLELHAQYKLGALNKKIASNIAPYSIKTLTRKVSGYLEEIILKNKVATTTLG